MAVEFPEMDAETAKLYEGDFEVRWADASKAAITVAQQTIQEVFGDELGLEEIARLVASPAGSVVEVNAADGEIAVEVYHQDLGLSMLRIFRRTDDGIVAEHGWIESNVKGKRIGIRIFATQVKNYRDQGIVRIETYAAGSKGGTLNGYSTWAAVGFNATFTDAQVSFLEDAGFEASDLHDLFLLYPDDAPE